MTMYLEVNTPPVQVFEFKLLFLTSKTATIAVVVQGTRQTVSFSLSPIILSWTFIFLNSFEFSSLTPSYAVNVFLGPRGTGNPLPENIFSSLHGRGWDMHCLCDTKVWGKWKKERNCWLPRPHGTCFSIINFAACTTGRSGFTKMGSFVMKRLTGMSSSSLILSRLWSTVLVPT